MAGGGGSTGYTSVPSAQGASHEFITRGKFYHEGTTTHYDWEGVAVTTPYGAYEEASTYVLQPSLLRFIHDYGTTDAGGNPYEGVSAYDPDSDFDSVDEVIADFQSLVSSLDHNSDWEDDVDSAIAQKDTAVPALDYESVFSSVITSALSRAAEAIGQAFADAKTDIQTLVDSTTTRGLADSKTAVDEATSDAASGVVSLMAGVQGAANTIDEDVKAARVDSTETLSQAVLNADPALGMAAVRSAAIDDGKVDEAVSDATTDAGTILTAAVAAAKEHAETIGGDSSASSAMGMLNQGSRSDAKEAMTDAASDAQDRSTLAMSEVYDETLDEGGVAADTSDWAVTDAVTDTGTAMADIETDSVLLHDIVAANGETLAGTTLENAKSKADAIASMVELDAAASADTIADAGVAKGRTFSLDLADDTIATAVSTGQSSTTTLESTIRVNAKDAMLDVIGSINPEVSPIIMEAVTNAKSAAMAVMLESVSAAIDSVQGAPIEKAVSGFRKRALKTHLRSVNRFAGGMADINAVNSSAFVIGMALLESDFTDNVTDFQSKLEMETFVQILPQFLSTFQITLAAYMDSYEKRFAETIDVYKSSLPMQTQIFLSLMPEYIRVYVTGFSEYMKTYHTIMSEYTATHQSTMAGYVGATGAANQVGAGMAGLQQQLLTAYTEIRSRMAIQLADLQTRMFTQSLTSHSSMSQSFASLYEDASKESVGSGGKLAKQLVDSYVQVFQQDVATRLGRSELLTGHSAELQRNLIATFAQVSQDDAGKRTARGDLQMNRYAELLSRLIDTRMNSYMQIVSEELKSIESKFIQHLGSFGQLSQTQISQAIGTELAEKGHKQAFMNEGIRTLNTSRIRELEGTRSLVALVADNAKSRVIAKSEEYDRNIEFDALAANWDVELFQQAGNVIGAVTGTVVPRAGKPSKTQSVLGGAASGASVGMSLGPWGAAIGAIAGGAVGGASG